MKFKRYQKSTIEIFTQYINNKVEKYFNIYHFDMTYKGEHRSYNNEADAFKHTFMQADLSLKYDFKFSKTVGNNHEGRTNNDFGEKNMDLWNNRQGRDIAREIMREYPNWENIPSNEIENLIASKIIKRMKSGRLITNPNDKRKYNEKLADILEKHNMTEDDYIQITKELYLRSKNNNMSTKDLINFILNKVKEQRKTYFKKYFGKTIKTQQNLKSQNRKPLNMNFAELIKQPQEVMAQNEQFNIPITAMKNQSLKYNYGQNKTANNTMKIQNEKMPSLYRGSTIRPQQFSTNNGQSILNSASNAPIRDIKYNNLPEFKPMNIPLENNPIFNFDTTNYTKGNFVTANNGGSFDMNGILKLSMNILRQYLSGGTGQDSGETRPQQYYEFIPE